MRNFRCAFFDMDGTLLDSLGVWEKIDRAFLGKRNFEMPADYMDKIAAMEFSAVAGYTIDRFGLAETPAELLVEWDAMALEEYACNIKLKKGAIDYLRRLQAVDIHLGVITSLPRKYFTPVMGNNGIEGLFKTIILTEDTGFSKSTPDIYFYAAKEAGMDTQNCIIFDDLPECIIAAARAGMEAWGVYDSHNKHLADRLRTLSHGFLNDFSNGPLPA